MIQAPQTARATLSPASAPVPAPIAPAAAAAEAEASTDPGAARLRLFYALWRATLVANIGNAMGSLGASWLMTSLSPSPLMVALVQAAATLPIAILALPGGALADVLERRRMLLVLTGLGMIPGLVLFASVLAGTTGSGLLLAMTFLGSCGIALCAPAFLAVTGEIVPRPMLPRAIGLGSVANGITRAAGPLLGGGLIAWLGTAWVFLADAVSALGVMVVLWRWTPAPRAFRHPPEHLIGAIRAGFRYAYESRELHSVLVRSSLFFVCASALWSLLPLLARDQLQFGPTGFGILLASVGCGAVCGSLLLPRLSRHVSPNRLLGLAPCLLACSMALLAESRSPWTAMAAAIPAGIAWSMMTASLQTAMQMGSAPWVGARTLGIFLMVFQGALTFGAILWGTVAAASGVPATLSLAAAVLVLSLGIAAKHPLSLSADSDFRPALQWPDPRSYRPIGEDRGPVLVIIEYRVEAGRTREFEDRLGRLRTIRMRDGALRWRSWSDVADDCSVLETFIVASWLEHLRQHERFTNDDRRVQDQVHALHIGPEAPLVRHFVAPELSDE